MIEDDEIIEEVHSTVSGAWITPDIVEQLQKAITIAREDERSRLIKDHIKEAIIEGQKNGVKAGEETLIRRDQIEKCIKILEEAQPYSAEVFLPRTKGDMARVARVLKKNTISPDGTFGSFGREVWNNAIQKLKDELV